MASKKIEIGNNIIYTAKGETPTPDMGRETILFGSESVVVGVKSGEQVIKTDENTGLRYMGDEIVQKEIYNLSKQKRKAFFILDLETGKRGWYPGAIKAGDVVESNIKIYEDMTRTSATIIIISNDSLEVISDEVDSDGNLWYNVKYHNKIGFILGTYVSNIRWSDPL